MNEFTKNYFVSSLKLQDERTKEQQARRTDPRVSS